MLLDAHTHFFSLPFFHALAAGSPLPGSVEERLAKLAGGTGLELPSPSVAAHTAKWIAALDAAGVDHAVTFASLPVEADAVAEAVRQAPTRLTGYALVNPAAQDAAAHTAAHFDAHGFKGILLFPAMHHVAMGAPACRAVLDVVAARRGVVVVHCGMLQVKLRDLLHLPRPFDLAYANPLDVIPVANAYPDAHFVIPHFGAGFFRECLMAGTMCENVYVDTSSSNAWMHTQAAPLDLEAVLGRALQVFGPERILFGTDSSVFPRGWRSDLHAEQLQALGRMGLDDVDCARIFGGNAARLLRLDAG